MHIAALQHYHAVSWKDMKSFDGKREKEKKKHIKLCTATFYLRVFSYIFCFFIYRRLRYVTRQCNARQTEENGVSDTTKESFVQINNRRPFIPAASNTLYNTDRQHITKGSSILLLRCIRLYIF
jgi:hypothetical protein